MHTLSPTLFPNETVKENRPFRFSPAKRYRDTTGKTEGNMTSSFRRSRSFTRPSSFCSPLPPLLKIFVFFFRCADFQIFFCRLELICFGSAFAFLRQFIAKGGGFSSIKMRFFTVGKELWGECAVLD